MKYDITEKHIKVLNNDKFFIDCKDVVMDDLKVVYDKKILNMNINDNILEFNFLFSKKNKTKLNIYLEDDIIEIDIERIEDPDIEISNNISLVKIVEEEVVAEPIKVIETLPEAKLEITTETERIVILRDEFKKLNGKYPKISFNNILTYYITNNVKKTDTITNMLKEKTINLKNTTNTSIKTIIFNCFEKKISDYTIKKIIVNLK